MITKGCLMRDTSYVVVVVAAAVVSKVSEVLLVGGELARRADQQRRAVRESLSVQAWPNMILVGSVRCSMQQLYAKEITRDARRGMESASRKARMGKG